MGILDETRVMDVILTSEGRRQMAEGTFAIKFATFSDSAVRYLSDGDDGHQNPAETIYFEACNLPQDQIVFEASDEGNITIQRQQAFLTNNEKSNATPFVSSSVYLKEGKLFFSDKYYGRAFRVNRVPPVSDNNKMLVMSDTGGIVGGIIFDYSRSDGIISSSLSERLTSVGMKNITFEKFTNAISSSLTILSGSAYGPHIPFRQSKNFFLLDYGQEQFGNLIHVANISDPLAPTGISLYADPDTGKQIKHIDVFKGTTNGNTFSGEVNSFQFASQISDILTSSIDNFSKLKIISTTDRIFEDDKFEITKSELKFATKSTNKTVDVDSADAFFSDFRLARIDNFRYLPPIVKREKNNQTIQNQEKLGDYPSFGENEVIYSPSTAGTAISNYFDNFERDVQKFEITQTSKNNNYVFQIFEISPEGAKKLDTLDFGEIEHNGKIKNVIFAGKVILDNRQIPKFFNIFTVVMGLCDD